jgi:hypothetical protein
MKTNQLATILFVRPKRRFVVFAMVLSLFPAQEIRLGALLTDASEAPSGIQTNQQALADAEEKSCIGNLRTLNMAQGIYSTEHVQKGFARKLEELGPKEGGGVEPVLASGKKSGYRFTLRPGRVNVHGVTEHYTISARPLKMVVPAQRSFFTDETGIIRATTEKRAASQSDAPIQ